MEKVEVFTKIETDPKEKVCSFVVTDKDFDYKSKLEELAKDNKHLADFEIKN